MFEVYKRIGWHNALKGIESQRDDGSLKVFDEMYKPDELLYTKMKNLISKLVVVEPADRMKLKEAREILKSLESLNDFLFLKECFRN